MNWLPDRKTQACDGPIARGAAWPWLHVGLDTGALDAHLGEYKAPA